MSMENYLAKKESKNAQKVTHFRSWKVGRQWLYASSIIAAMAGGVFVSEIPVVNAHADTVSAITTTFNNSNAKSSEESVAASSAALLVSESAPASDVSSNLNTKVDSATNMTLSSANTYGTDNRSLTGIENSAESASREPLTSVARLNDETQDSESSSIANISAASVDYSSNAADSSQYSVAVVNKQTVSSISVGSLMRANQGISNASAPSFGKDDFKIGSLANSGEGDTENVNDVSPTQESNASLGAQFQNLANDNYTAIVLAATASVAAPTASTSAIDLTKVADTISSAYNQTLSGAIGQLIGSAGIANAVSLVSGIVDKASSLFGSNAEAKTVLGIANTALGAVSQAVKIASGLGIDPSGLVSAALSNGINLLGQGIENQLSPLVTKIPVIGSKLMDTIKPMLSNLSGISPSGVVSGLASAAGLSGALALISNVNKTVAPGIINAAQWVINKVSDVTNGIKNFVNGSSSFAKQLLQPVQSVFKGLTTPIQSVLSNVISRLKNLFQPVQTGTTTVTTNSANSAVISNSVLTSATSSPAATVQPSVVTKNLKIETGQTWLPTDNFVSATDSNNQQVSLSHMSALGTVNTEMPGTYIVLLQFTDSISHKVVSAMASVVVEDPDPIVLAQASLAVSKAQNAIVRDTAVIDELTNSLSALPHSNSNLSDRFTSTSNYPTTSSVYVAAPSSGAIFSPNVNEIGKYALLYVNELRQLNGQKTVSYSSEETSFAQQRAQDIITDFSHDKANGSTENIGGNSNITTHLLSNQEIAYYMVMDWYDESDNPEPLGDGHYGHRANLLFGGPSAGIGFVHNPLITTTSKFADYYAFEAPIFTDASLYTKAKLMSNSLTNPQTLPLPNVTFVYIDSEKFTELNSKLIQAQQQLAADNLVLVNAKQQYLTV